MQSRGTVLVLKLQEIKQIWIPKKQCSQFYTYYEIAMDLGVRITKQREFRLIVQSLFTKTKLHYFHEQYRVNKIPNVTFTSSYCFVNKYYFNSKSFLWIKKNVRLLICLFMLYLNKRNSCKHLSQSLNILTIPSLFIFKCLMKIKTNLSST